MYLLNILYTSCVICQMRDVIYVKWEIQSKPWHFVLYFGAICFAHDQFKLFFEVMYFANIFHTISEIHVKFGLCKWRWTFSSCILFFKNVFYIFEMTKIQIYFCVTLIKSFLPYEKRILLFVDIFHFCVKNKQFLWFTNLILIPKSRVCI